MEIDVTEQTFQTEVLDRSRQLPVVVDFWAEWCGPCRQLTPVLEKAAAEREGDVVLAKVDTDANPGLSQAFGIQGIPAVKAFRDGEVVSEFVGAQPPQRVAEFFDALVPSEADRLAAGEDEASLRRALELDARQPEAAYKLALILHGRGEDDEALALTSELAGHFGAEGLAARIRLEREDGLDLGDALAALDRGEVEAGLDGLIEALPSADGRRDDIRRVVVGVLDELGVEDPRSREYRRRLAGALY